jgi:type II secretory pathway pseudopilin PulG
MTDDVSDPRPAPRPTPHPTPAARGPFLTRRVLLWVAAVVVVVLAAALAWSLVRVHQRDTELSAARLELSADQQLDAARTGALKAAESYAVDFGSYDYAHLDADFRRVTAHLTPSFAKKYASVSSGLRSVIQQYHGRSSAVVQGAAIASITTSKAVALVFLDQTVTTTQSKTPRIDRNRMQMSMQRKPGGSWLISDLALK